MPDRGPVTKPTPAKAPARAVRAQARLTDADAALLALGRWLASQDYHFISPTPVTHALVNARAKRAGAVAGSAHDVFGWSRPFSSSLLPSTVVALLERGGALDRRGDLLASRVRFSTLGDALYMHSSFPTSDADAVFFGPDTYRFAAFIEATLALAPVTTAQRIVDVGCGTGAGGIVALRAASSTGGLTLTDISAKALRFARINAALNGVPAEFFQCDLFSGVDGDIDLIVANPPYLVDPKGRLYRDGGGTQGQELSLRIVREGIMQLSVGGALLLYTGSCIVNGDDLLRSQIVACVNEACARGVSLELSYRELDPDVFGEELALPGYETVDRIAVVGAVIRRSSSPHRTGVTRAML